MEGHPLATPNPLLEIPRQPDLSIGGSGSQGRLFPFPWSEGARGKTPRLPNPGSNRNSRGSHHSGDQFWSDLDPSVGGSPKALISADFKGDGKLDIAAASLDSVTVALGTGQGN